MTARELIEALSEAPDEAKVLIYDESGVWEIGDVLVPGEGARVDLLMGEQQHFRPPLHVHIHRLLGSLDRKVDRIMANIDALNAAVDNLAAGEAAAAAELQALAAEVATLEAGAVTQGQIDAVTQRVTDVATALSSATEAASGAPPAGAAPAEPAPSGDTPPPDAPPPA